MTALLLPAPGGRHILRMLVMLFGALIVFGSLQTASAERTASVQVAAPVGTTALPPYQDDRTWYNWYRPGGNHSASSNSIDVANRLEDAFDPVVHVINNPRTEGEKQTAKFVEYLAGIKDSHIPPPQVSLDSIESTIKGRLGRRDKRIKVNFILMGGSNGDTAVISSLLSQMLRQPDLFNVKHAVVAPWSYRGFFPDELKRTFHRDNRDWEKKRKDDENTRFGRKVVEVMKEEPDLLIIGHMLSVGLHWKKALDSRLFGQFEEAIKATPRRVTVDTMVYYQPDSLAERTWSLDKVTPWSMRLYLQEPSLWNNPNPMALGAPMTGKASGVSGAAKPGQETGAVYDWLRRQRQDSRQIAYLGIGTDLREYDKTKTTPLFAQYVDRVLRAPTNSFSFVILHNWRYDDAQFPRESHGGRVFHLFYGEAALIDLFKKVDVVVTHGGVGSLTDAIQAGKPQIIIPIPDIAPDQEFFARRIEHSMGIGVGLPPIRRRQLIGDEPRYSVSVLSDGMQRVVKNYKRFAAATQPYREQLEANDSVRNNMEVILRAMEGHFARKQADKKSGKISRSLYRMDMERRASRVPIAAA